MAKKFFRKHKSGRAVWVAAIATLLLGVFLLIWPGVAMDLILNILGTGLIVAGFYNILRYFLGKDPYDRFSWELGAGVALAAGGIALIVLKDFLLSIVPALFGIALLIGGIVKLQLALNMRRMAYGRWHWSLAGSLVSCVLGVLILAHPFGTGLMLIRVIGGSIAVEAIQDLVSIHSYDDAVTTYFVD